MATQPNAAAAAAKKFKGKFVYSTLSAPVQYQNYLPAVEGAPLTAKQSVLIEGGAGVADKNLYTPQGVRTPISEDDEAALRTNPVFLLHEKNGYITISDEEIDPNVFAAMLEGRDRSAPVVPQDYLLNGKQAPKVGAAE